MYGVRTNDVVPMLHPVDNEIEGLYDKIIITVVPNYSGKNVAVCCCWHCSRATHS